MKLTDLAHHLGQEVIEPKQASSTVFEGLAEHTSQVKPGNVFVVVPCDRAELHVKTAIKAGAVALIVEAEFA